MKHTTLRQDFRLVGSVIEGLKDWKGLFPRPADEWKRLLDEMERAEARGRISLLEEGLSLRKAAEWLRNMAANFDRILDYAVAKVNDLPPAVLARVLVNAWIALNASNALREESR